MDIKNAPFRKLGPLDIARPWLPVTVINPHTNKKLLVLGLIDTGADECAFPAQLAVILGHDLQSGCMREIGTGNGKTVAYSHTIRLDVNGFSFPEILIDFLPNLHVPLLGVRSFLSNFVLTIDYPREIFSLVIHASQ